MKRTAEDFRDKHPDYFEAFLEAHRNALLPHHGHGPEHDLAVLGWILFLDTDDERTQVLASIAALAHSSDRMIGREDPAKVREFVLELLSHLSVGELSNDEQEIVIDAVLKHGQRNQPGSSPVLQMLQDGDKLANLMPHVISRSGQFHPDLPVLDLEFLDSRDPASTYRNPTTCLEDLWGCVEWREMFNSEQARKIAEPFVQYLEGYLRFIADSHRMIHLLGFKLHK